MVGKHKVFFCCMFRRVSILCLLWVGGCPNDVVLPPYVHFFPLSVYKSVAGHILFLTSTERLFGVVCLKIDRLLLEHIEDATI